MKRNNKKRILLVLSLFLMIAIPTFYFGFGGKNVIDNIINNTSKKSSTYTMYYYRNTSDTDTEVYTVNYTLTDANTKKYYNGQTTFGLPDNWKNPGYVLRGWSPYKTGKDENGIEKVFNLFEYPESDYDLRNFNKTSTPDKWYAIWEPVNKEYGNVVFIGDSYVNSSQWPQKLAAQLGIGHSYTIIHKPGTGFLRTVFPMGEMWKTLSDSDTDKELFYDKDANEYHRTVRFKDYVKLADRIIGNNNDVYWFVVLAGYNDIPYSQEELYNAIQEFNGLIHTRFPNAHVAIGMAGTDFTHHTEETTLLTTVTEGYKTGIEAFGDFGHYVTPTIDGVKFSSISDALRNWGNLDAGVAEHGCFEYDPKTTPDCYYKFEEKPYDYDEPPQYFTGHPTVLGGDLIAKWAGDYLKTQKSLVVPSFNYTYTDLKSLSVPGYDIDFSAGTTSYSITVPYTTNSITINAEALESSSTVTGTGSKSITKSSETFDVVVKDINNSTKTYKLTVYREAAPSNDATLKSLSISNNTLDKTFNPSEEDYYITVVRGENNTFTINGQTTDTNATVEGLGSKTATSSTVYNVKVTAQNKTTTKTYRIHVTVNDPEPVYSNNTKLESITPGGNTIVEETVTDTRTSYNVRISSKYKNYGLVFKTKDSNATLTFRPKNSYILKISAGELSYTGYITSSSEDYELIVTAEDQITEQIYNIRIYYNDALSTDTSVDSITVTGCTADSDNNYSKKRITFYCPMDINSININVSTHDSHATVSGAGQRTVSDSTSAGYSVTVTAQDGLVSELYPVTINKVDYSDDRILDLSFGDYLDNLFNPNQTIYSITVPSDVTSIPVSYKIAYNNKIVNETFNLTGDSNTWSVEINSLDGNNHKNYVVKVNRPSSNNAYLRSLSVNGHTLSPEFNRDTENYSIDVGYNVNMVTIDYVIDATGITNSEVFVLSSDKSTWSKEIVAADGITKKTYSITVNRAATNNADLRSLSFSTGTLSPEFNKNQLTYTLNVDENVDKVGVSYIIDYNDTQTAKYIDINDDETNWSYTVTAANGTTKKTYSVTIIRAKSSNAYLSSLTVSQGTLSPVFDKDTLDYTVNVGEDVSSIIFTYVKEQNGQSSSVERQLNPGENTWSVTVTAPNGTTKKTYSVTVNRAKSSNAFLRSLSVNGHSLNPAFNKNTFNYNLNVGNEVTMLTIDYVIDYNGNSNSIVKVIEGFKDTWSIDVQAQNGSIKTYTITINRAKSANADLKSITISKGTLSPVFNKNQLLYTVNVDEFTSSIDITTTKDFDNSTDTKHVELDYGQNNWSTTITAQDGVTTKTYTIIINRALSSNANLKSIAVSSGTLSPSFDKDVTEYTLTVDYEVESINIDCVKDFNNQIITDSLDLKVGVNNYNKTIISQNGEVTKKYSIIITRNKSKNADLKSLSVDSDYSLDKEFDPAVLDYTVTVPLALDKINITAVPEHNVSTVTGTGVIDLIADKTVVNVLVTAQDGVTIKNYVVTINKIRSSDATLKDLSVSGYSLDKKFDSNVLDYTVDIPYRNTVVNINAVKNNYGATIEGNGIVDLVNVGELVPVTVIAEDGTKKVYTIRFNRIKSSDATLSSFVVDGYTLSPKFTSDITEYSITVPNETTEVLVTAIAKDPNAEIVGNNKITINDDTTVAEFDVVAEDKVTSKKYTLTINRALSSNANITNVKTTLGTVISPLFDKDVYNYTITTNNRNLQISYTYEATGINSIEDIVLLPNETSKTITVTSKSPDESVTKNYVFNIVYENNSILTDAGDIKILSEMSGDVFNVLFDTTTNDFSLSDFEVLDKNILEIKNNKIIPKSAGTTKLIYNEYAIDVTVPTVVNQAKSICSVVDKMSVRELLTKAKNITNSGYLGNSYLVDDINVIISNDNIATVSGTDLIVLQSGTTNVVLEENGVVYNFDIDTTITSPSQEDNGEVKGVEENPQTGVYHYILYILFTSMIVLSIVYRKTIKTTLFKKI